MIIPIAVIVLLLSIFKLKDTKEKSDASLDTLSVILSSIGFGGLLYGFSSAGDKGWGDVEVYSTLIAGTIALILLIVRQFRLEEPMLDFRVYKHPMFSLSSAISIVVNMAMFSAMILMPIYLQNIRGISPLDSGLLMLPGAIIMGIMSPVTGNLFDKFGGRVLAIVGLTITVITTYFFSELTMDTSYTTLIVMYSIRMLGISMVMMPVMTNGMNSLPARMNPHGTAINNTLNQVSGAIGSALLVSVMTSRTKIHAEELAEKAMSKLTGQPSPEAIAQMKAEIGAQATVDGINDAFFAATFIAALALILAFFIKRPKRADEQIKSKETQNLSH
jgi:EmrB/QacA subfamily drug resistance transporter